MFKRQLLLTVWLVVLVALVGCVKPPVKDLEETRRLIIYLQESGAAQLAEVEYRAAEAALGRAEQFVKQGDYRKAKNTLAQARELSSDALKLSDQRKDRLAEEQKLQAEKRAREAAANKVKEKQPPVAKEPVKPPVTTNVPKVESEPEPIVEPESEPKPVLVTHVEVAEEDTLASISARKDVYQDASLWPLIYKANRDQIKNPQEIFAGQILLIPRDKSEEDRVAARQEAKELNLF